MQIRIYLLLVLVVAVASQENVNNGGNLICVMASGDITDFGYSNTVNSGRIYMERRLNISGSLFASNINNETACLDLVDDLAAKGYKLIISTTTAHANCPIIAAKKHTDINFVMASGTGNLPNLATLSWSGPDQYYAAGGFCGANSKVKKVGFVHPGPPLAAVQTLNSFYVGVKDVCPDCTVYSIYTDSYLNPDRTTGACDKLLAMGVDMLAGQQDDLTLVKKVIAEGFLAVGINGFPLSNIFGETVGVSILRNWGPPFTQYASNALNGPYNVSITETFARDLSLDTPSHLVSSTVWEKVLERIDFLKYNKTKPYFCSEWVKEMGALKPNTTCLANTTIFNTYRLPAIQHLGTYHVPLTYIPFANGAKIAIIVIASILYVITCIIAIAVFCWHKDAVMLAASPTFLGLVLIGIATALSTAIVWVSDPTSSTCSARVWLPSLGVTLGVGALIVKNIRLMLIFDAQVKKVRIRDLKLLIWVSILLLVDILLLGLWSGLGKPHVDTPTGVNGNGPYEFIKVCKTTSQGDSLLYAIITWHAAQLLVGCFVTFRIRVIDIEEFNESRPFGLSIYVVSLVYVIAGILVGTSMPTDKQLIIIVSLSFIIGSAAVLVLLFAPKFLTIFVKGNRTLATFLNTAVRNRGHTTGSGSGGTSKGSGGTSNSKSERDTSDRSANEMTFTATTADTKSKDAAAV